MAPEKRIPESVYVRTASERLVYLALRNDCETITEIAEWARIRYNEAYYAAAQLRERDIVCREPNIEDPREWLYRLEDEEGVA
jgi:hypothetical protein